MFMIYPLSRKREIKTPLKIQRICQTAQMTRHEDVKEQ